MTNLPHIRAREGPWLRGVLACVCFVLAAAAILRAEDDRDPTLDSLRRAAAPDGAEKTLQFLADPGSEDRAWMLTERAVKYTASVRQGAGWKTRFDGDTFERLTGKEPGERYRHRKIQFSKATPGALLLLVENPAGSDRGAYVFRTTDQGATWKWARLGPKGAVPSAFSSRAGSSRPVKKRGKASIPDEAVDLSDLDTDSVTPPGKSGGSPPRGHDRGQKGMAGAPLFKVLFDLWLWARPGVTQLSFDNFHSLMLVDFFPKPELQFSFEVSPAPRYYELTYRVSPGFSVRGGRIWIPFDQAHPHNLFGGYMNVSRLRQPGTEAFLPDVWTDLGLALQVQLADSRELALEGQLYVVNGFGAGGTDPLNEVSLRYPRFEPQGVADNNGDKAFGLRLHALISSVFGLGFSAYTCRYTDETDAGQRLSILGADASLNLSGGTLFRAGYVTFKAELPAPSTAPDLGRSGMYAELTQRFAEKWKLYGRIGQSQNDNRLTNIADVRFVGGGLIYDLGLVQFSIQHFRDINEVAGKRGTQWTALRATALF